MATDTYSTELPSDVVADLLATPRRRLLLATLARADDCLPVATLAAHVAAAERDVPVEAVGPEERRRVWTALHDEDLPKLVATDVVAYDSTRDAVSLSRAARQLKGRLE
ncbi:DUF7344 domain-containing protein [Halomarina ordinaria]|uniref:DUF7344 domain-containing protein n=1 Tax=Halomarina ordinaria TaxID=3033939 RepID=A0ABD5U4A8_9EURY|nr:hypothetical protein [Halomarina sp. PSRA2]